MAGRPKVTDAEIEDVKKVLLTPSPKAQQRIPTADLLSLGSTLINLGCSGRTQGAIGKGQCALLVGDSSSGKTFFTMTMFAEACRNRNFDEYDLIYDGPEDGAKMDLTKFFGKKLADRLRPPAYDADEQPLHSFLVEDFLYNIDDAHKRGVPFIYAIDSLDALDSRQAEKKFNEQKTAARKGKDEGGSFTDGKAKKYSENLRRIIHKLQDTRSILLLLSQTRDNIGAGMFESQKTRAGGRAPRFYSDIEIWTSQRATLTKEINKKKRKIGILVKAEIKKNRIQGWEGAVEVPIYRSYGIDDIGSCVDFLIAEGAWTKTKSGIKTNADFPCSGESREAVIRWIEESGSQRKLQKAVADCWRGIEQACSLDRAPRYS